MCELMLNDHRIAGIYICSLISYTPQVVENRSMLATLFAWKRVVLELRVYPMPMPGAGGEHV